MFRKTVTDVLKNAEKVIKDLEDAASHTQEEANKKREDIEDLLDRVEYLDKEYKRGSNVATKFRELIS